uniref:Uncharacterized protein n=1 Tax=viral metagenome TaxID=1070528 RepID=A0A6M3Y3D8_9ZZZZ
MARGAPDWVSMVQVAVTVENVPIIPDPATEYALDTYGSVSTSSATLQTLFSRTVPADRVGILNAIELSCDNYDVAIFEIVVKGVTIVDNETIPESFTKDFPELHLAAAEAVTVKVKSDGSTTINAWCDVSYKEVG